MSQESRIGRHQEDPAALQKKLNDTFALTDKQGVKESSVDRPLNYIPESEWTWFKIPGTPYLKVRRTDPAAKLPAYKRPGDAGLDICTLHPLWLSRESIQLVETGLEIEIMPGYEATIRPRSGLSALGYYVALGTIDHTYRGPLRVQMAVLFAPAYDQMNRSPEPHFEVGDRIAQLVVSPVTTVSVEEVQSLSETVRGVGSFGSSGVK